MNERFIANICRLVTKMLDNPEEKEKFRAEFTEKDAAVRQRFFSGLDPNSYTFSKVGYSMDQFSEEIWMLSAQMNMMATSLQSESDFKGNSIEIANETGPESLNFLKKIQGQIGNKSLEPREFYRGKDFDSPDLLKQIQSKDRNGIADFDKLVQRMDVERDRRTKIVDVWIEEELLSEAKQQANSSKYPLGNIGRVDKKIRDLGDSFQDESYPKSGSKSNFSNRQSSRFRDRLAEKKTEIVNLESSRGSTPRKPLEPEANEITFSKSSFQDQYLMHRQRGKRNIFRESEEPVQDETRK